MRTYARDLRVGHDHGRRRADVGRLRRINPAPAPWIMPERKIPPKIPNFGKSFPYLPGKPFR